MTAGSVWGPLSSSSVSWPWHSVKVKPVRRGEAGVDPFDAALGIADQDGIGHPVGDQGEFLIGALGALQGSLDLFQDLALLFEGVVSHVKFV